MLKTMAGVGISMLALGQTATAHPRDVVWEFVVQNDSLEELRCSTLQPDQEPPPGFDCTITEGPAPYKLATLTLTHAARTSHQAQWSRDWQGEDTVDDGHVVSLVMASPDYGPDVPFKPVWLAAWTFDLKIRGDHISGDIDVEDVTGIGSAGCFLTMRGSNNNWAGTWRCGSPRAPATLLHSFTAISIPVEREHIAKR